MKKIKLILLQCLIVMTSQSVFAQNGLNFDGTNDYVQTNSNGVVAANNRTFEAWIYVSTNPTANMTILDYGANAVGSRNTFMVTSSEGLNFTSGGTNANIGSAASIVPIGQWSHAAFVLNNGTGFLYLNGVQVATGNLTTVFTPLGTGVRIGERVSGGSIPFKGVIDEVRIWNVARTQAEIAADMNNELCGTPAGLLAYYKFNEGIAGGANSTVTTAVDQVNGVNGTLLNFALIGATSNWVTGKTLGVGSVVNNQTLNECAGSSVTVGSSTYNTTGNYIDTLVGASAAGCDSIVNTNLTIATAIINNQTLNECAGSSVTVGSNTYNTTGNYIDTLVGASAAGCDSIVNTNLTIAAQISGSQTLNECTGFSITIGSNTYNTTGNYIDTLVGASATGCDSIVNTNLTIAAQITSNQTVSGCAGFSITIGSNTYSTTGNYIDTLVGAAASGCDSIVNTNLTIAAAIDITVVITSLTLTANQTGASYKWLDCDNNFTAISGANSQAYTATANGNYAVEITLGNCIDTSACESITTVGINEIDKNTVSIYPNPSSNKILVNLGDHVDNIYYTLTSLTGKVILENTVENTNTFSIDISNEANGVYFLKLNDIIYKVIKE